MKIQIPSPSNEDTLIQLIDFSGQLIKSVVINKGNRSTAINIESLNDGIYFVQFHGNDYHTTKKVMILSN